MFSLLDWDFCLSKVDLGSEVSIFILPATDPDDKLFVKSELFFKLYFVFLKTGVDG